MPTPAQAPAPDPSLVPGTEMAVPPDVVPGIAAAGTLPQDLSPWGMFLSADVVVQAVLIGLLAASVVTWTVGLAKLLDLRAARRQLAAALTLLGGAATVGEAAGAATARTGVAAALLRAASAEFRLSAGISSEAGLKERVLSRFERIESAAIRRMMRGTGILATIGSTAPFVGLFGTVWGIMNSFIGISKMQTTNLAIVAPGIAEALLATAVALVVAIPAVVIYNHLARATAGYRLLLGDVAAEILRLVSRDIDRASSAPARRAAE
jgi:biopolymer transport protein ExbB